MTRTEQEAAFAGAEKFALRIAWSFAQATGLAIDDLAQVARMALWTAVLAFDPDNEAGADLLTFARRGIRGRLIDAIATGNKHNIHRVISSVTDPENDWIFAVEFVDTLPAPSVCTTDRADVTALIECLSPSERAVITGRYLQGRTGEAIGAELGVTRARVSQIEKSALLHLRDLFITGFPFPVAKA